MKKILQILILCISIGVTAQTINRTAVNGKIIVEVSDIEGIAIYNSNTKIGTITNQEGRFTINVALNDIVEIKSLEYQNFNIKINQNILDSKRLSVYLIEEINMLDEVVVSNTQLTGNIKTDIAKVKTFSPKRDAFYFGVKPLKTSEYYNAQKKAISNVTKHSQNTHKVKQWLTV